MAALHSEDDVTATVEAPEERTAFKPEERSAFRPEVRSSTKENNYDRELREAESAMRRWKEEMRKMKEEIDARPTKKDLDDGKTKKM